jgi:UDPglucose 6-dehydrogenase
MQISVIGAGYVGLVTGVSLAARGHRVQIIERSPERLEALRDGRVPFSEPGLPELMAQHRDALTIADALPEAGPGELTFIAVGTPIDGGESDLSQLKGASDKLRRWPDAHVSVRSTLPPGTSARLPSLLGRPDARNLSTNPEFLRQGSAVEDFMSPSRIVFGRFPETSDEHMAVLEGAYEQFPGRQLVVDATSAELLKNAANAFLALKLSFVNEIAQLAEEYGADVEQVLTGIGLDPRIGSSYMRPGLGFGGSCLPKELQALAVAGRKKGLSMHVARAAALVNDEQQDRFARAVLRSLPAAGARVGLLGLSFKADTDDLRGSPALTIARRLLDAGHRVVAYDPAVPPTTAQAAVPGLETAGQAEDIFDSADAVVIATEWTVFRDLDWPRLHSAMRGSLLFDGRNLLDRATAQAAGYTYRGIGMGTPDNVARE